LLQLRNHKEKLVVIYSDAELSGAAVH